jgi:CYTH domain-containing protein
MENMEIEKKYTIKELPKNLEQYECEIIKQAYLNTAPVVRVRQSNDKYILTYKGEGLMEREEYTLPLDKKSFEHLLKKADGNIISKKRYIIPIDNPKFNDTCVPIVMPKLNIELDLFDKPFAPLVIAEVEFSCIELAEAFIAPDWFDEDVTNNPEYHNSNMSMREF